jgi:hypothetical protein
VRALYSNTSGGDNTASGFEALFSNTTGNYNTASGFDALYVNTTGSNNSAFGLDALYFNNTGGNNTASGFEALYSNATGSDNTAFGFGALQNNTAGSSNVAIGSGAGIRLTSGNKNILLGNKGVASESNTMRLGQTQTRTFIAGIAGVPVSGSTVLINGKGQLGILASSARYKRDIRDMADSSQRLLDLRPVTFRYKQDASGERQYGLVAEEVVKVYPELVVRSGTGEVQSVKYEELIPMLLNQIQHQQKQLDGQAEQNGALAARLRRLEEAASATTIARR